MATPVAIAIGSNLGDRDSHLAFAIEQLGALLTGLRVSRIIETDPFQTGPQPRYLNAVAAGETDLLLRPFFDALRAIEHARLRERPYKGAPRTLDLDLILYGCLVADEPDLVVPHPRFRERTFVLAPLAEVAPGMRDPVSGATVTELLEWLITPRRDHL